MEPSNEMKVGKKVVVLTGKYAPTLSEGAVGTVTVSETANNYYEVEFSSNRRFVFHADQIRLATAGEIAQDAFDPDLDEQFTSND